MAESVDGGKRRVKKGKLERVPHLHFKLGGRLFAALYSAGLVLIATDGRRAASVPVRFRHHVKICAGKNSNVAILGRATCCLMLQVKGQRVSLKSDAECVLLRYAMLPCHVLLGFIVDIQNIPLFKSSFLPNTDNLSLLSDSLGCVFSPDEAKLLRSFILLLARGVTWSFTLFYGAR